MRGLEIAKFAAIYLPALIANGSATLIARGSPIDMRIVLPDGKRLLGDGKTWEGFSLALLYAFSITLLEAQYLQDASIVVLGFLSALGALLGDLAGSFIKRRVGLKRGEQAPLLDQLDFILGAYMLTMLAGYRPPLIPSLALLALVYALHRLTNYVAYKLGIKNVPW